MPAAAIAFDADGAPTKAAEGFARKCGVDAASLVRRVDSDGREYVFAERSVPSTPAEPILTALSERVIGSLEWPNYRSQRWGSTHETFVRPIRWICAMLGSDVVPVSYADVTSGNVTRGHRVLAPGEHVVPEASAYEGVLEGAFVLSAERRAETIREGIARIEAERGGARVDTPKRIFDEVGLGEVRGARGGAHASLVLPRLLGDRGGEPLHALDLLEHRPEALLEGDRPKAGDKVLHRVLQVLVIEELGVVEARANDLLVAGDNGVGDARVGVRDDHELAGEGA